MPALNGRPMSRPESLRRVGLTRRSLAIAVAGIVSVIAAGAIDAQTTRIDYRVVYASTRQLSRQLDEAGRDGFACVRVAQPDSATTVPGIVAILGRPPGGSLTVAHRVVTAGGLGRDLQAPLEQAAAEGFRLCGVALDEGAAVPQIVAIMVRDTITPGAARRYGVEVLTNYKESLVRLDAAAREGFRPVAASPINNNRVREMRSWLVVTERTGGTVPPREIAVRSSPGADGILKALNEQAARGFCADLIWKEGADVVAMMSHRRDDATASCGYATDTLSLANVHRVSHRYVADVLFRAPDDHLIISNGRISATNDVEEDVLPALGVYGYVEARTMGILGNHISRHDAAEPVSATVRRLPTGAIVLTTVVSDRVR